MFTSSLLFLHFRSPPLSAVGVVLSVASTMVGEASCPLLSDACSVMFLTVLTGISWTCASPHSGLKGFQAVRRDREGCPRQLRQGLWQARRHRRRRRPKPSERLLPPHASLQLWRTFVPWITFSGLVYLLYGVQFIIFSLHDTQPLSLGYDAHCHELRIFRSMRKARRRKGTMKILTTRCLGA